MEKKMQQFQKRIYDLKKIGFSLKQFMLLFMLAVIMIAFFSYRQINQMIQEEKNVMISDMQVNLEQSNRAIDNYNESIRILLLSLLTREDIFTLKSVEIDSILKNILYNNTIASVLYSVSDKGSVCSSAPALYRAVGAFQAEETLEQSRNQPGIMRYSRPYYSHVTAGYTVFAAMTSGDGKRSVGVEVNTLYLYSTVEALLKGRQQGGFFVASGQGDIFVFDRIDEFGLVEPGVYPLRLKEIYCELAEDMELTRLESGKIRNSGYQYMFSDQNDLHWRVFQIYDPEIFQRQWTEARRNFYITLLGGVLLSGIILLGVSVWFTKPLRQMAQTMERVRVIEDLEVINIDRKDEIGRLWNSYNHLVSRIHSLMENLKDVEKKKSQYEIRALQNQIGPHFLHNTLACIACLIRQNQDQKAGEAIKALIGLLSYGFDKTDEKVTLKEEVETIENYVCIQRMRYGDAFGFEVVIGSGLEKCMIPKLMIQPILENAIFHGVMARYDEEGRILLRALECGGELHVYVEDNGPGMTRKQCDLILMGEQKVTKEGRMSGIGVSNVNERLKLLYGPEYGIIIRSEPGIGTVVELRIPLV